MSIAGASCALERQERHVDNLLLEDFFREAIDTDQESWRKVVANLE